MDQTTVNAANLLRSSKVDLLSTKNLDMKMRRVVDAAPAQDPNDYVILDQLTKAKADLIDTINSLNNKIVSIKNSLYSFVFTATSTADLTLSAVHQDIPGTSISIPKIGVYVGFANVYFNMQGGGGDAGVTFASTMVLGGVSLSAGMFFGPPNTAGTTLSSATVSQVHAFTIPSLPTIVKLQAWKSGGTGSSAAKNGLCTLTVLWVEPS